jgi:hypothetical protein
MRSCGRTKKRDGAGRPLGIRAGAGGVASIIDVLLSKNRTGGAGVMVNGHERSMEEKTCQYNIFGGQP